ncbi:MAG TPA: polysaccharide deacetylase family protein [Thermoanaerobaculia bacterium]|nr:polysaccharide deacetylase family protein [Thermoanaerobaculia bacterium]
MSFRENPSALTRRFAPPSPASGRGYSLVSLGAALLILLILAGPPAFASRSVAFTFDDLPGIGGCDMASLERLNRKLVAAIRRHGIPAAGLVVESRVCPRQRHRIGKLYEIWLDAGLELGNHTHSHRDLNRTDLAEYQADVLAGEKTLRPLLEARGKPLRYFRHPFLRSGTELPKKRAFEAFLREHGYTILPVTIDNDEYIYAAAYDGALKRGEGELAERLAGDYIRYMESIFAFYERLSRETLGYELPQILLLHVNRLNADHLRPLAEMARRRGYRFVSAGEALRDEAYGREDAYTGARGLSWLQRWAIDDGTRPPLHPEVPGWVMDLYRRR